MPDLKDYFSRTHAVPEHKPWSRFQLDEHGWNDMIHQLAVSDWTLLGLWAYGNEVYAAFRDVTIAVVSFECRERRFKSLTEVRPAAARLERTIRDLFGLIPEGIADFRPWLDHGRWSQSQPLSNVHCGIPTGSIDYHFLSTDGQNLHQIPVGPVHAGVIESGHFRFTCSGETIVRLEERFGYKHRGIEGLIVGKNLIEASKIIGRISGDSTVAYAIAFARAVEAATCTEVPPRAHWIRALMSELERISNHIFDFGAICNDVAFSFMLSKCMTIREQILQTNNICFGHRLLMDKIIPGGVTIDLTSEGVRVLSDLIKELRKQICKLADIYDNMPILQNRTIGTGIVKSALAHRFGAGGVVGRSSSQSCDARKNPGYPPYDDLNFDVPVHLEGDVNSRILQRIEEIQVSIGLIEQILKLIPDGSLFNQTKKCDGEGMALIESFRGEILLWIRLSKTGHVLRCHPRDPSWFQWPLLESAIEGNIVADFPVCNKSFNCSYSGVDL
ncbi:MAG: nickel-dependent hydrogenase large subunit [Rhodospirillaceae bacterium]|jgi:Ni,Fe-hydrogenase III large subunit|nr:nickel-dependent hydrogenase large subunit [Rhodospirillaceae bacterium]